MARSVLALLAALACLSTAAVAGAELYKWVDADGNVHFSDSPPRGAAAVDLSEKPDAAEASDAAPRSGSRRGIAYGGAEPSRLAFLREVMVQFENVPPGSARCGPGARAAIRAPSGSRAATR